MMPTNIRRVGFIGLGRMGSVMAHNLLRAGFKLTVYNRTPTKARSLVEVGASQAASPKEAALGADVVITSLMDDQSVLDVVTGDEGLLAGLRAGGIHIDASTSSPRLAKQLAELHTVHGSFYLAAPWWAGPMLLKHASWLLSSPVIQMQFTDRVLFSMLIP